MTLINAMANIRYWIVAALVLGLLVGDIGESSPTVVMVALIAMMSISLMGLDLNRDDVIRRRKEILIAVICCYVVACVVTLIIGSFFDPVLWSGWVLIASVPCAISVVSASLILKGDVKLALMSMTIIYLLALVLTPLLTKILIGDAVSPLEILKYVILFILVPIIISIPLKKVSMKPNTRNVMINICFFILIFVAFGSNRSFIMERPELIFAVALGCLGRIVLVHVIMEFVLRKMNVERDTRIVFVLMSIWKNSALAMTLAMILIPQAEAAIPGALSLPLEMVWFMVMMWYYERKCPPQDTVEGRTVELNTT